MSGAQFKLRWKRASCDFRDVYLCLLSDADFYWNSSFNIQLEAILILILLFESLDSQVVFQNPKVS